MIKQLSRIPLVIRALPQSGTTMPRGFRPQQKLKAPPKGPVQAGPLERRQIGESQQRGRTRNLRWEVSGVKFFDKRKGEHQFKPSF